VILCEEYDKYDIARMTRILVFFYRLANVYGNDTWIRGGRD